MRLAERHEVIIIMGATVCQRLDVMHFLCCMDPVVSQAINTQGMP